MSASKALTGTNDEMLPASAERFDADSASSESAHDDAAAHENGAPE
jgi:hypothetical protein